MLITDSRVRTMNEILNSIKLIKMYAWEDSFEKKVAGKKPGCCLLLVFNSFLDFIYQGDHLYHPRSETQFKEALKVEGKMFARVQGSGGGGNWQHRNNMFQLVFHT